MAITKIIGAIHPPKSGNRYKVLNNTIDYILNPEKTAGGLYTGARNCFTDTALADMVRTKEYYGKTSSRKSERLGYHIAISFSPEEQVPPEVAFHVVGEFAEKYLGEDYEAVYSVHTDCGHMHGHICFNSVNLRTGYKYRYEDGDWAKSIQPVVDALCQKYGLHTLSMDTGVTNEEYEQQQKEKKKQSYYRKREHQAEQRAGKSNNKYHNDAKEPYAWNTHLCAAIDQFILKSSSYPEFEQHLRMAGYQIKSGNSEKYGPYIKIKAPGMGIFRKTYQLGKEYTLSRITERILVKTKPMPEYAIPDGAVMLVPVRYFVRMKRRPLSAAMKRYYARLYRLGVKPHYPKRHLTYQDVKAAAAAADRMERQMDLVVRYQIGTAEGADEALSRCIREMDAVKEEQKAVAGLHAPYKRVVYLYKRKRKLEEKLLSMQSPEERAGIRADCERITKEIERSGLSEEQLPGYIENYDAKRKELRRRLRDAEENVKAAQEVRKEFRNEAEPYTGEMEKFYESVSDRETARRSEVQKGRAK